MRTWPRRYDPRWYYPLPRPRPEVVVWSAGPSGRFRSGRVLALPHNMWPGHRRCKARRDLFVESFHHVPGGSKQLPSHDVQQNNPQQWIDHAEHDPGDRVPGSVRLRVLPRLHQSDDAENDRQRAEYEPQNRNEPEHAQVIGRQCGTVSVGDHGREADAAARWRTAVRIRREVIEVVEVILDATRAALVPVGGHQNSSLTGCRLYSASGIGRPCGPGRSLCGSSPSPRNTVAATSPEVTGRDFGA